MRRPPSLTLDDVDLRRANPPRGVALPAPRGGIALLRSRIEDDSYAFRQDRPGLVEGVKAALADGRAPTDVDVAAMAIAVLKASERIADDPVVDDVNETLLGWFESPELALRALARRTPLVFSAKAMTGYYEEDRCAWLALARVLGRANEKEYARAKSVAANMRVKSKSSAFRHAVAMAFPTEPWATDDARGYLKRKSEAELRWYEKVAMLLCANEDVSVARSLMRDMLADRHGIGSTSEPAFALVYRFGAEIQDELIAAFLANVKKRGLYGPHDRESNLIAGALAYIGTPDVAAVLTARVGKHVGGDAAKRFFARFPDTAKPGAKTSAGRETARRVAIAGDFEIFGETPEAWRKHRIEPSTHADWGGLAAPRSKRSVGEILDEWSKRILVETTSHVGRAKTDRGGGVKLRGVVEEPTFRAHFSELVAAFRFGAEHGARSGGEVTGTLLACVLGTDDGVRFEASEMGESSMDRLEDSIEDDESIREAVGRTERKATAKKKTPVKRPAGRRHRIRKRLRREVA